MRIFTKISAHCVATHPAIILGLLCIMYMTSFYHRASPAIVSIDLMRDLLITPANIGLIGSATMLGYALTQIPAGVLADRWGAKFTLMIYQAIAGICVVGFSFAWNFESAVATRFILGLALALNVPAMKMLALWVPASSFSKYTSILLAFSPVGSLLASSPLAIVVGLIGWRLPFLCAGIFTLLLAVVTFVCMQDQPPSFSFATKRENIAPTTSESFKAILHNKNFWLVFVWFMCMIGNFFAFATMWWGTYIMHGCGISRDSAGFCLLVMSIAPMPCMPIMAMISDNIVHSRKIFLVLGAVISFATFLSLTMIDSIPTVVALSVYGGLLTVSSVGVGTLAFTMVKESIPPSSLGFALGMLNAGAPVLAAVVQASFGYLLTWLTHPDSLNVFYAYKQAFYMPTAIAFIAFLVALPMKDTFNANNDA